MMKSIAIAALCATIGLAVAQGGFEGSSFGLGGGGQGGLLRVVKWLKWNN